VYSVIIASKEQILGSIHRRELEDYERLLQEAGRASAKDYQRRYKIFWAMNRASNSFCTKYFELLEAGNMLDLSRLLQILDEPSTRRDGRRAVQFSFITKLLHTRNPKLPVYDSRVARFFLFEPPSGANRIPRLMAFYEFLAGEYARIIGGGHLADAIRAFRQRFQPLQHSDEKIIDWLIWAFVGLSRIAELFWIAGLFTGESPLLMGDKLFPPLAARREKISPHLTRSLPPLQLPPLAHSLDNDTLKFDNGSRLN
jgi:hypothetical protein